ncbi:MAG: hypothetical protein IPM26_05275 [Saprospiraceae bacterium]|nr:hypothetical protein [Saprospiraceae bacterium]
MQKIVLLSLYLIFTGCLTNKNDSILVNDDNVILYLQKDTAMLFSLRSVYPAVFLKNDYLFCLEKSSVIGCYDRNRRDYEVCLNISKSDQSSIIIQCSDSCAKQTKLLSNNVFYDIKNKIRQFKWDSVKIQYNFSDHTKELILHSKEIADFKTNKHPFTVHEEIYFMYNLNYGIYYAESTNENSISIAVYSKGKVIARYEGNVIPVALRSVFEFK